MSRNWCTQRYGDAATAAHPNPIEFKKIPVLSMMFYDCLNIFDKSLTNLESVRERF